MSAYSFAKHFGVVHLIKQADFFLSEAAHPWKVLTKAGYEIDYVSLKGGEALVNGFNLEDKVSKEFWETLKCQAY
ncbi:hypothetical protein ACFSKU_06970 [Pontibacter silvestris]|uniref:Uncharacterized protein n=1 Tax=Pontibacter silvestris TaxID=2305183 RepID=A0ABW4WWR7_9BACT|nr:hypothetical protein [Pontibacter silvestris]MCC9136531.1 hypothetical protein [Pontibacter silvestris]